MRILCVCDHGSNRSVHVADQLRFRGHETLPVSVQHLSVDTLRMLAGWCDLAIFTGAAQHEMLPWVDESVLWLLPENPRPYNPDTLRLVRAYVANSGL